MHTSTMNYVRRGRAFAVASCCKIYGCVRYKSICLRHSGLKVSEKELRVKMFSIWRPHFLIHYELDSFTFRKKMINISS